MPTFKDMKSLQSYVNKMGMGKLNILSNNQLKNALEREGDRLKGYLEDEIQAYYNSYSPTVYQRTYNFLNSVRITPVIQEGNNLTIQIYFDEDMATHDSIFGGEDGYVPILLNYGFKWHDKTGPYRLAFYEGYNFISKVIQRYNQNNPNGFKIIEHAEHNGNIVKHQEY